MGKDPSFVFKAFMSHRYKSSAINLYFFTLFAEVAEVQFEVDKGTIATNVTRLERKVRDSDGFIGVYPFETPADHVPLREELLHASRYFRLELDLAIRSGKPAIVFCDRRYRGVFRCPPTVPLLEFDSAETTGAGGSPAAERYRKAFRSFCEAVVAWRAYEVTRPGLERRRNKVALVLPPDAGLEAGYSTELVELLRSILLEAGYSDTVRGAWPPVLGRDVLSQSSEIDWAIADIADAASVGVVAYLHGSFVPTMRLARIPDVGQEGGRTLPLEHVLYGGIEVGYSKDIVRWNNQQTLEEGVRVRLTSLDPPQERISTFTEAQDYFRRAALRKEAVFLSYSGRDGDVAQELSAALKKRFQTVYDYRDAGESIRPGQPWLETIYDHLSATAIGIPLLSDGYVASGNCLHEGREMIAIRDSGDMTVIPIKLTPGPLELPPFLRDTQYLRLWEHRDPDMAVTTLVRALEERKHNPRPTSP